MFDDLIRELKKYEHGHSIKVSLPIDEHGYLDRQCPAKECGADFKLFQEDCEKREHNDPLFCPICKHEAAGDDFTTEAQIEFAKQYAFAEFSKKIGNALATGARRFNSRPQRGFITMKLEYKPDSRPVRLPKAVGEAMEQRFTCERCSARYSSIGAAYFCPACGHNSVLSTFDQTLKQVRETVTALQAVRVAFGENRDAAENALRLILEQSLTKLVGGFERFSEALFIKKSSSAIKLKRGVFQRLSEASELWKTNFGKGYETILGVQEFEDLQKAFQRRHLIAHREGIVDEEYRTKSGDMSLAVGQRIRVGEDEVIRTLSLLEALSHGMRK